ncbi:MAG: response regulator transcription factor [Verrucomicrobia bacterium]|nr:response regulator transcription factor [Verrucomicrobiota bacterium]
MKFALVEDQVMFRSLLHRLLVEECKGKVVLEAGSLAELRAKVEVLTTADLLLLDIRLPDGDGVDFVDEMVKRQVSVPVLLFSSSCEDYIVHRVNRSFVQGFVHKDEDPKVLLTAIQMVAAGGAFFSPRFVERQRALAKTPDTFEKKLSPREQELLRYIGAGFSDAETAAALGMTASTAQTHRRNVMAKLDLHSAKDLQAYALRTGFTTIDRLQ